MGFLIFIIAMFIIVVINGTAIYYAGVVAKGENIDIASTCKLVFILYLLMTIVGGVFGPGSGASSYAPVFFNLAINVIFFYILVNKMAIKGAANIIIFVVLSIIFTIIGIVIFNILMNLLV